MHNSAATSQILRSDRHSAKPKILPITIRNLRFAAADTNLIGIDELDISTEEPSVILGPNGAGKSLLLRLLHGLIEPTAGQINFAGNLLSSSIRRRQAMVFQRPVILRRTVAENVHYPLKARGVSRIQRETKVALLLEAANLAAKAHQPARSLSGGEQQLVSLIRALATDPDILFLDEPTSSLDPGMTQLIEKMIVNASQTGTKIIMVSHDLGQSRRLAHEVLFCHHGRIVEQSMAVEFFERPRSITARNFVAGELVL